LFSPGEERQRKKAMRYFGFAVREHYLEKVVDLTPDMAVLEIGVGAGKAVEILRDRVKEYWGVDKSAELVEWLKSTYEMDQQRRKYDAGKENRDAQLKSPATSGLNNKSSLTDGVAKSPTGGRSDAGGGIRLLCLDVCAEGADLGRSFDVVFSLDTLEHVECPGRFFSFMARHLEDDGRGAVLFPNESAERHHGVTWFEDEGALRRAIEEAGLEVVRLLELRMSAWHRAIKAVFWTAPKRLTRISPSPSSFRSSSSFDETEAFRLARMKGPAAQLAALYAGAVSRLARLFPLYRERKIRGGEVRDRRLLLLVRRVQVPPAALPGP